MFNAIVVCSKYTFIAPRCESQLSAAAPVNRKATSLPHLAIHIFIPTKAKQPALCLIAHLNRAKS